MRRRRRPSDSHSVTLFPFLAVLICTFGVLIVLLVIVVKAADHENQLHVTETRDDIQSAIEQTQLDLELQQIRAEGLVSLQPELLQNLSDQKHRQAYLQSELDELSSEIELLNLQIQRSLEGNAQTTREEFEQQLVILTRQLEDEEDLLKKKRASLEGLVDDRYSIVPYSGGNGTQRRPIYIECTAKGLTIQPYGLVLTPRDFVQPILPNNPLDAALIAVREYFLKSRLADNNESPYPLIVVRPDGSEAYALARHAMKSWDEEFGYELVPSEKELDYGEGDQQLAEAISTAIEAAKRRQKEYIADKMLRPSQLHVQRVTTDGGLQASGNLGGFVSSNGSVRKAAGEQAIPDSKRDFNPSNPGKHDSSAQRAADIAVKGIDSEPSIASRKGRNWALPSKSQGAIAYRRPVKVFVTAEEIIVDSDSQSNRRETIPIQSEVRESVDMLVEAIWRRIETWGVAGVGGYWKPELDVIVLPGGEPSLKSLKSLLVESGIDIREQTNDK